MEPNWAEENLQTIRTLMERSALYRRALAPIMIICGISGLAGGVVGWQWHLNFVREFILVWGATAFFALACTMLLVRQQAVKASEPFWSPPARRVMQALLPSFVVGAFVAASIVYWDMGGVIYPVIILWSWLYGFALHSAGFFMPRGMKLFGWAFIISGCLLASSALSDEVVDCLVQHPHLLMSGIFGGLHIAYGLYLYFTEKKNPVA